MQLNFGDYEIAAFFAIFRRIRIPREEGTRDRIRMNLGDDGQIREVVYSIVVVLLSRSQIWLIARTQRKHEPWRHLELVLQEKVGFILDVIGFSITVIDIDRVKHSQLK